MSNIFSKIFASTSNSDPEDVISSRDLKIALMGAKRERRKKQMELKRIRQKKTDFIERLKKARREGRKEDVDFLYEEMNQLKVDAHYARREDHVLRLETIGIQRYLRTVERLEKTSDKGRIRNIMKKVQSANLQEKLQAATVDEEAYLDSLGLVMDDVQAELEDVDMVQFSEDSKEKEDFLNQLDEIIAAEEEGKSTEAEEKQEFLKSTLEKEEPDF